MTYPTRCGAWPLSTMVIFAQSLEKVKLAASDGVLANAGLREHLESRKERPKSLDLGSRNRVSFARLRAFSQIM